MSFGFQAFDAAGNALIDTAKAAYVCMGSVAPGSLAHPSGALLDLCTTAGQSVIGMGGDYYEYITTFGRAGAVGFVPPSRNVMQHNGPGYGDLNLYDCSDAVTSFGRPTTSAAGFGFEIRSDDGYPLFSDSYFALSVFQSGSATADAIATPDVAGQPQNPGSTTALPPQNITFAKALDRPPLIFITASSGYVAFFGFVKDGNGKYVGARICSWCAAGGSYGWPVIEQSATFDYFLVEDARPVHAAGWGFELFAADGSLLADGSLRPPNIRALSSFAQQYVTCYLIQQGNGYQPYIWGFSSPAATTCTHAIDGLGVCINPFAAFNGVIHLPILASYGMPAGNAGYGDYLHVTPGAISYTPKTTTCLVAGAGTLQYNVLCNTTSIPLLLATP